MGWRALGKRTAELVRTVGAHTVASEGRAETAALGATVRHPGSRGDLWPITKVPDHHFNLSAAARCLGGGTHCAREPMWLRVPRHALLPRRDAAWGRDGLGAGPLSTRQIHAFEAAGRSPIEPIGSCVPAQEASE